jgi:hypothetical protein
MTTTTERIAQAVAPIIAETMREYRERCAQLEVSERLTRAAHDDRVRERDEALATIDDLNRQLDEAHKENARLILQQMNQPAPVVEEQGPWVIRSDAVAGVYFFAVPERSGFNSPNVDDARQFATKQEAFDLVANRYDGWHVVSIDEAKRNG